MATQLCFYVWRDIKKRTTITTRRIFRGKTWRVIRVEDEGRGGARKTTRRNGTHRETSSWETARGVPAPCRAREDAWRDSCEYGSVAVLFSSADTEPFCLPVDTENQNSSSSFTYIYVYAAVQVK